MKQTFSIKGDNFKIENALDKVSETLTDEQINEKYIKGEIRIITEQARYPLDSIHIMLDSGKYLRNPEYQRRKRWNDSRKSKLIESFIMNVPIPPIFLYESEYSLYEVMDGLQRLTAIDDFYKNKFKLTGLQYWKELNNKFYKELPDQVKKGIDRRYLSSIILLQETAKTKEEAEFLKQIVFERLNSGGELLTPQETRNALYNGHFNQFCITLSKNDSFRKMWNMPLESAGEDELLKNLPYSKMEDVELVLRFFAYRHIDKIKGTTVEKFLDEYLKQANFFSEDTLIRMEELFNNTIEILFNIFQETAFFLPSIKQDNKTPSKTVYDPLMQSIANFSMHKSELIRSADKIRNERFKDKKKLFHSTDNTKYIFDGKYQTKTDVKHRIAYFNELIGKYIV
jgi:hypothetical protein